MEYRILGDYVEVKGGKRLPKGETLIDHKTDHPYLRIKDYSNGRVDLNNMKYITSGTFDKISRYVINKGDIFLSIVGTIGIVDFINDNLDNASLTENAVKIRSKDEKVLSTEFLSYFLKSDQGQYEMDIRTVGSTQPKLAISRIKNINIPVVNIKTQQNITKILRNIDEKIDINEKIIANLEELSQTIFKRWFIDFEFPDENGNPYKSSGGEFKIVEGEAIPRTWKKEKLGNIITITSGKRPITKSNVKNSKYKYPIIGASKVMGFTNEYKYEDRRFIIGRVGTHGIIQEFNERIWPSDNTFVIKTEYWNYVKNILLDIDYNALNRGSTQPLITQTDLKNTQILVPDNLNKISDFEKFFEAQSSKIFTLKKEITYLESLRNTLLPKLMSGEIELPENLEV